MTLFDLRTTAPTGRRLRFGEDTRGRSEEPLGRAARSDAGGRTTGRGSTGSRCSRACGRSAGWLTEAISKVVQAPVELDLRRPDRHRRPRGARSSTSTCREGTDLERLHRSLLTLLGPAVVVREVEAVAADFDARFSARSRTYRYRVHHAPVPDPFTAHLAWHVPDELDRRPPRPRADPSSWGSTTSRRSAAGPSRCRAGTPPSPGPPGARAPAGTDLGEGHLRFEIQATAFCHQMVRSIVGTVVAAGQGRVQPGDIRGILLAETGAQAAQIAPGHGLCLWEVEY